MKKIVSTALVCAMLASMTVTSFAEVAALSGSSEVSALSEDTIANYTNVKIEHKKVEGDDALYFPLYIEKANIQIPDGVTEANVPELVYIVDDETDLENGKINSDDIKDFEDLKLSVKVTSGQEYVASTELDIIDDEEAPAEEDGKYAVILNLEDYFDVDSVTIKGTAKISKKTGSTISEYDFSYKIDNTNNMAVVTPGSVTGYTTGIEVDDDEVTIDYAEFDGNVVNFKNGIEYLYLEGEYFGFDVKLSNQGKLAMKMDNDVNKAVSRRASSDADLTFFNFRGNPTFDFTGTMTFTLPDEDKEYFVYKIEKDDSLTQINAKLNEDGDALEFKTRTLSSYVLSDEELETSAPSEDDEVTGDNEGAGNGGSNSGSEDEGNKGNPSTGSADFVGLAAGLATAAVAAAGAVTLRKKEK